MHDREDRAAAVTGALIEILGWLEGRCRSVQAQFPAISWEDLFQEAAKHALEYVARGFFDDEDQLELTHRLMGAFNRYFLAKARESLQPSGPTVVGLKPEEAEKIWAGVEWLEPDPGLEIDLDRALTSLEAILSAMVPTRGLALRATDYPISARLQHFEASETYSLGLRRSKIPLRPPQEGHHLLQGALGDHYPRATDIAWSKFVTELLYEEGPIHGWPSETSRENFRRLLFNARRDLAERLGEAIDAS